MRSYFFPNVLSYFLISAGGASANVALYDLRMTSDGGPLSKVVQLYRPRGLSDDAQVSVSGIDLSKNKKELLVSYENDQIYTFPICPTAACGSGPSVDEMSELARETKEKEICQPELCAYGGHLNRYTFLKVSILMCNTYGCCERWS